MHKYDKCINMINMGIWQMYEYDKCMNIHDFQVLFSMDILECNDSGDCDDVFDVGTTNVVGFNVGDNVGG